MPPVIWSGMHPCTVTAMHPLHPCSPAELPNAAPTCMSPCLSACPLTGRRQAGATCAACARHRVRKQMGCATLRPGGLRCAQVPCCSSHHQSVRHVRVVGGHGCLATVSLEDRTGQQRCTAPAHGFGSGLGQFSGLRGAFNRIHRDVACGMLCLAMMRVPLPHELCYSLHYGFTALGDAGGTECECRVTF
jgi:hypothetical protein